MRILSLTLLLLTIILPQFAQSQEGGTSLSVLPQTGTFTVRSTFDISIFLNTGGNNVNAVQVDLKFDPTKLQVVTPASGISAVGEWIFPPSFSNSRGTITLKGGFPGQGINTSEGLISVIVFRAVSSGEAVLNFLDSSVVISSDKRENILTSVNRAVFHIIPSPPKGPRIFSETHPDQNRWYKNTTPSFTWSETMGAEGYSYELNDDPLGEPDNVIDTESSSISFEEVEEGIQYFHLKANKLGVWGGTSHFKIMIDNTPPSLFKPSIEPFSFSVGKNLFIYFNTGDLLSGIDYYQVRIANYTDPQNIVWSGWVQQESPFKLSKEEKGVFQVFIRAFDKAGNFREEKIQARILNSVLVIISGGIQAGGIFFPWWLIYLLIIVIFAGIGYLIFRIMKKKPGVEKVDLEKEIREAEKEIEDVRKAKEKLRKMRISEERGSKEWQRLKGVLGEETQSDETKSDEIKS